MASRESIQDRFDRYHADNPEVYAELVATARRLLQAGRRHYGMAAIFEVVRYHRDLDSEHEGGFKMTNDFRSRYARLIMDREPDLVGFFDLRPLRTK